MTSLAAQVEAILAPVLPAALYGCGWQGASDERPDAASLLWCVGRDELLAFFPQLERSGVLGEDDHPTACVDLMIEVEDGLLTRADWEFPSLSELFEALGDDAGAARARALIGLSAPDVLDDLAALLRHLFEVARGAEQPD